VIGLTRSAALEYAPRGIRINAVCPGTIDTPMVAAMLEGQADAMKERMRDQQPIGRMGSSDEIAAAVLWLCSPGASFVIGVALPVDGVSPLVDLPRAGTRSSPQGKPASSWRVLGRCFARGRHQLVPKLWPVTLVP
jgi:hypothetical protein